MSQYINGALALLQLARSGESAVKRLRTYAATAPRVPRRSRVPSRLSRKLRARRPRGGLRASRPAPATSFHNANIENMAAAYKWYEGGASAADRATKWNLNQDYQRALKSNSVASNLYPFQKTIIYKRRRYLKKKFVPKKKMPFRKRYYKKKY